MSTPLLHCGVSMSHWRKRPNPTPSGTRQNSLIISFNSWPDGSNKRNWWAYSFTRESRLTNDGLRVSVTKLLRSPNDIHLIWEKTVTKY
jgi:hypothetical protein